MSDTKEKVRDEKEVAIISEGVEYVYKRSNGYECPFCSARMGQGEQPAPRALKQHVRLRHPTQAVLAMTQDTLEPVMRVDAEDDSPHALAGIKLQEDYDRFDALYIPEKLRREAQQRGDVLRWSAPDKVRRRLDQGAELVARDGDEVGPRQGSTEDSSLRANEMRLVRIPEEMAVRMQRQKAARIERNLSASKEAYEQSREGVEKVVFDSLKAKGYDSQTAGQVARAVAGKAQREDTWQGGDPNAHQGITITNKHGERRIA